MLRGLTRFISDRNGVLSLIFRTCVNSDRYGVVSLEGSTRFSSNGDGTFTLVPKTRTIPNCNSTIRLEHGGFEGPNGDGFNGNEIEFETIIPAISSVGIKWIFVKSKIHAIYFILCGFFKHID